MSSSLSVLLNHATSFPSSFSLFFKASYIIPCWSGTFNANGIHASMLCVLVYFFVFLYIFLSVYMSVCAWPCLASFNKFDYGYRVMVKMRLASAWHGLSFTKDWFKKIIWSVNLALLLKVCLTPELIVSKLHSFRSHAWGVRFHFILTHVTWAFLSLYLHRFACCSMCIIMAAFLAFIKCLVIYMKII